MFGHSDISIISCPISVVCFYSVGIQGHFDHKSGTVLKYYWCLGDRTLSKGLSFSQAGKVGALC